jgi:hypothetical protein
MDRAASGNMPYRWAPFSQPFDGAVAQGIQPFFTASVLRLRSQSGSAHHTFEQRWFYRFVWIAASHVLPRVA